MRAPLLLFASVPLCLVVAAACGASDSKEKVASEAGLDAGAGGGTSTGSGGKSATGGKGTLGGGNPGAGGGTAGAGGALPIPDAGDASVSLANATFFSVSPSSKGLAGTGVASKAPHPETTIFASNGTGPQRRAGTNMVVVTAAQLGLLEEDDLDAIAALKPIPVHPFYYFSIKSSSETEGWTSTDLYRSSEEHDHAADIFASHGIGEHYDGESGKRPGPNMLVTDQSGLGLEPAVKPLPGDAGAAMQLDDVDALEIGTPAGPMKVYFSVRKSAKGAPGSAIAGTPANERGCTIYERTASGTSAVAYHCSDLGLVAGDELDALDVEGASAPQQILFSVERGSAGAVGSAVATEVLANEAEGDIFRSTGTGTNERLVDEAGLGIEPQYLNPAAKGDLDALSVVDLEIKPRLEARDSACHDLSPNPLRVEASYGSISARTYVSDGIFVIMRTMQPTFYDVLAYDVATCRQVGSTVTLESQTVSPSHAMAVVPKSGWSRTAPLTNVEIWSIGDDAAASLVRYTDQGGLPAQSLSLTSAISLSKHAMLYRAATDDFFVKVSENGSQRGYFIPRPATTATTATISGNYPVPFPCTEGSAHVIGHSPQSGINMVANGYVHYVCELDDQLHFRAFPRPWQTATDAGVPIVNYFSSGFVDPDKGAYVFTSTGLAEQLFTMVPLP